MDSTILETSISTDQEESSQSQLPKVSLRSLAQLGRGHPTRCYCLSNYTMLISIFYELCEFDFEPFNADKKVSSLDQFLSYMNEEDIFDCFPGIGNIIATDLVHAASYLHSRDIVPSDGKPANVLVSNSHYKS